MNSLPAELSLHILALISDVKDLLALSSINRKFHTLYKDNEQHLLSTSIEVLPAHIQQYLLMVASAPHWKHSPPSSRLAFLEAPFPVPPPAPSFLKRCLHISRQAEAFQKLASDFYLADEGCVPPARVLSIVTYICFLHARLSGNWAVSQEFFSFDKLWPEETPAFARFEDGFWEWVDLVYMEEGVEIRGDPAVVLMDACVDRYLWRWRPVDLCVVERTRMCEIAWGIAEEKSIQEAREAIASRPVLSHEPDEFPSW